MYSDREKKLLAQQLRILHGVCESALAHRRHAWPAFFQVLVNGEKGGKKPLDLDLDFRRQENAKLFNEFGVPVINTLLTRAAKVGLDEIYLYAECPEITICLQRGAFPVGGAQPKLRLLPT